MSLSPVNCTDAAQIKADEEKAQKVAHAKQVQDAKKKEDAAAKKRREKVEHAQIQKGTVAFRFFFLKKNRFIYTNNAYPVVLCLNAVTAPSWFLTTSTPFFPLFKFHAHTDMEVTLQKIDKSRTEETQLKKDL